MADDLLTSMTQTFYGGPVKDQAADPARLFFINGERKGEFFELSEKRTWLGRAEENQIRLPEDNVSKQHVLILNEENGSYHLIDHHSTNGTFLNGRAIAPGIPCGLTHGDIIAITDYELIFLNNRSAVNKDYSEQIAIDLDAVRREADELVGQHPDVLNYARRERPSTR